MSRKVGATTKGWIKNNVTGEKKSFMYNPPELEYERSVTYADISAPGLPYPNTQFVKGNARSFTVELFIFDKPYTGRYKEYMLFLGEFLPPETNVSGYTRPPDMTFCFGFFIRKCVMESFTVKVEDWDRNLNPTQVRYTMQLRQVSP